MLLLALLGGCTAGPSDRPPVAVRDANLAPQRFPQALPSSPPLPPAGDYYRNSLPWRDCTDAISTALGMASQRRVECSEFRVDAAADRPVFGPSWTVTP
jgi:hypothetical protein